jgi:hypothetical protein
MVLRIRTPDGLEIIYETDENKQPSQTTQNETILDSNKSTLPYDTVTIENLTNQGHKYIKFYKDGKLLTLASGIKQLKTGWLKYVATPQQEDNVAVFRNVKVILEPEKPYISNNELIADKVYIQPI